MAVFSTPLLFSLYTNDCTSKDTSVKLLKFADDTTLIGLIQDGDESAYRQEVKELAVWFSLNNLELNTLKTVEMIADFSRSSPPSFRFFFNNLVQLEDTTIKTEHGCSMQRTERTTVVNQSSLGLHCRGCPDQISCAAGFNSRKKL